MKREFSAGGVIINKPRTLFLLTKSSPSLLFPKSIWRLPKGWLDDTKDGKNPGPMASGERKATEEEMQNGALREVREEAGIHAKILNKLGTETYFIQIKDERIMKFVTYLMEWTADLSEGFGFETSEVGWFEFNDSYKLLNNRAEKKMIKKAQEIINRGI
jgi:8-oxo-dGTP pyrophosphatase MutT (NUDIX family)